MLKKLLLALICLPAALAGFSAQLTATLQSGDKVTPFYGESSFVDAYNAAIDGGVITLSPGLFTSAEIQKSITVIGTYAFNTDDSKTTRFSSLTVSADNVTLEGLRFTGTLLIKGADQLTVSRCYIPTLGEIEKTEHKYHDNTIITDCLVQNFEAMSLSKNAVIRNCSIRYFSNMNETANLALVENCNVALFKRYWANSSYYRQPYAIYRNCFLGLYNQNSRTYTETPTFAPYSPSEFYDNYFGCSYSNGATSSYIRYWKIDYGSCTNSGNSSGTWDSISLESGVPRYDSFTQYDGRGPVDHKGYPAIPSITSSEIDTKTDAEGNLHVKISATARD